MRRRVKHSVIGLSAVLGILLIGLLLHHYWPALHLLRQPAFNRATFIHAFRGRGWVAAFPLALLLMAVTIIPGAPNSMIAIVSGICLGAPLGFVVNVIGLSLGNAIGALMVDRIEDHHQAKHQSRLLNDLLKMRHPRLGVMLGYSVPFVPNTLVHLAAAQLAIKRPQLDQLIVLGSLPSAFFYAFGGDAVLHFDLKRVLIAVILIGASAGLIMLIRRDRRDLEHK
jgi:uncharacterized membrane protein YdjX (TVP38/TMEM64 family)